MENTNNINSKMKMVFEDWEIRELQGDPTISIMTPSSKTKQSLKECIEAHLDEAVMSRYENKAYELTNILKMFDAGYEESFIKSQFNKIEKKRPSIL